ncbi:DinB family protein [Aquimarina aggregata]|uniref:DinB family protein n=1 Tax=Aquimarina aggregata TaxID=1642818 RepID=UPI002490A089|nr:DinB family protein [Aquimarina aggregata]
MSELVNKEFKEQIIYRLNESTRMISLCFDQLPEEDIWKRPNTNSNSIGHLIVHLCGNITQYVIASLGGLEDNRERDKEFAEEKTHSKKQLLEKLKSTLYRAKEIIQNISEEELLRKREVQGFTFSGIGILIHVTEHYSYHTGQIAFWIKQLKDKKSLGFYDGIDLSIKNKKS